MGSEEPQICLPETFILTNLACFVSYLFIEFIVPSRGFENPFSWNRHWLVGQLSIPQLHLLIRYTNWVRLLIVLWSCSNACFNMGFLSTYHWSQPLSGFLFWALSVWLTLVSLFTKLVCCFNILATLFHPYNTLSWTQSFLNDQSESYC